MVILIVCFYTSSLDFLYVTHLVILADLCFAKAIRAKSGRHRKPEGSTVERLGIVGIVEERRQFISSLAGNAVYVDNLCPGIRLAYLEGKYFALGL